MLHLGGDGGADLGSAVPHVRVPQACRRVQVPVPVRVPHPDVLCALDHELGLTHRTHVGVRMPEACIRTHCLTSLGRARRGYRSGERYAAAARQWRDVRACVLTAWGAQRTFGCDVSLRDA